MISKRALLSKLLVLLLITIGPALYGGVEVSFDQTNFDDSKISRSDMGDFDAAVMEYTPSLSPTSDFSLQAQATSDPLALRTTNVIDVSAIVSERPNRWKAIDAVSAATSQLDTVAVVQGVPGGGPGTLDILWEVTGSIQLQLQNVARATIPNLSVLTTLESTIPGAGGELFREFHSNPPGETTINESSTVGPDLASVSVGFPGGTEIPINFKLFTKLELSAINQDFGSFDADMMADFGQSAILRGVAIYDASGNFLPNARLTSTDGSFQYPSITPVPEPCAIAGWMLLSAVASWNIARSRKVSASS